MPSFPPVQAVVRAIELLQALNRQPVSTLDVLYKQTGIPKPSLIRLLESLASKGLVRHAPQYGAYYLTSLVNTLSSGYHSEPRIVEAARPRLDALTEAIKWPLAIAVFDTDAMVVRYSTIPHSPLSLLHSSINLRRSLVGRALGLAYLAFCDPQEREFILDVVRRTGREEDALAHDPEGLERLLEETRRQGYALRVPELSQQSCTLAVPVFHHGGVAATLGLTWFSSVMTSVEAVDRYLARLVESADQVSRGLGRFKPESSREP